MNNFETHVALIRMQEAKISLADARFTAWREGPEGYKHRVALMSQSAGGVQASGETKSK